MDVANVLGKVNTVPFEKFNAAMQSFDNAVFEYIGIPAPIAEASQLLSNAVPYEIQKINFEDATLWSAMIVILLQPILWNCIARFEYYTRVLSKVLIKPIIGVYALAIWIFVAGRYRDALVFLAIRNQDSIEALSSVQFQIVGMTCSFVGAVLVLSSFYSLGMTGTFLGDYFGILMDEKVTSFPFNMFSHPMYDGSTLLFLGKAIL